MAKTTTAGRSSASNKTSGGLDSIADLPDLKVIHNGEKIPGTFTATEMESRLNKLRAYMAEEGIAHVLLTSYHNINYYSDFLYCSFGRLYGLVVTPSRS